VVAEGGSGQTGTGGGLPSDLHEGPCGDYEIEDGQEVI